MWHDSSRKGGEPFSLAGNKCTSLSLGLQPERPSALQLEWEKLRGCNISKSSWGQMAYFSHTHTHTQTHTPHTLSIERARVINCQWFWFWWRGDWDDHMTDVVNLKRQIKWQVRPFHGFQFRWGSFYEWRQRLKKPWPRQNSVFLQGFSINENDLAFYTFLLPHTIQSAVSWVTDGCCN